MATGNCPLVLHPRRRVVFGQPVHRPGPARRRGGVLLEYWSDGAWHRRDLWISEPSTTNNRMAITSAILALGALRERCTGPLPLGLPVPGEGGLGVDARLEAQRGWKRKGGPIENLDLWRRLDRIAAQARGDLGCGSGATPGIARNEYVNESGPESGRGAVRGAPEPVPSGFEDWLEREREESERYLDYFEFAPPEAEAGG